MSFPYNAEELEGSPTLSINTDGTRATRIFRVPVWTDWSAFAALLIGSYNSVGGVVSVTPGIAFPGAPFLLCTGIEIEPMDAENPSGTNASLTYGTNEYPSHGAKITASYTSRFDDNTAGHPNTPNVPDGTWLEVEGDIGAEKVVIPAREVWYSTGAPNEPMGDDVTLHQVVPLEEFSLTWNYVTRPPWTAMRGKVGKVNSAAFFGHDAEQVLYLGSTYNRQFQFVQNPGFWKISHKFAARKTFKANGDPVGWNHVLRANGTSADFVAATFDSTILDPPYRTTTFDALFAYE